LELIRKLHYSIYTHFLFVSLWLNSYGIKIKFNYTYNIFIKFSTSYETSRLFSIDLQDEIIPL
jgi:hypothetical protein